MKAEEIARTSVDGRQSGDNPTAFQRLDLAVQETGFEDAVCIRPWRLDIRSGLGAEGVVRQWIELRIEIHMVHF
jgi:hypothetical protein